MSRYDAAVSAADLDGGEQEPTDVCIDCGQEIPIGFLRCADCDEKHDDFETNGTTDPRR